MDDHISEEAGGFGDGQNIQMGSPARSSPQSQGSEATERFSRKVFVGGLPPDIDEGECEHLNGDKWLRRDASVCVYAAAEAMEIKCAGCGRSASTMLKVWKVMIP